MGSFQRSGEGYPGKPTYCSPLGEMLGVSRLGRLLTTPWEWRYNQVELCPCLSLLTPGLCCTDLPAVAAHRNRLHNLKGGL